MKLKSCVEFVYLVEAECNWECTFFIFIYRLFCFSGTTWLTFLSLFDVSWLKLYTIKITYQTYRQAAMGKITQEHNENLSSLPTYKVRCVKQWFTHLCSLSMSRNFFATKFSSIVFIIKPHNRNLRYFLQLDLVRIIIL